jgi:hypothetical protein
MVTAWFEGRGPALLLDLTGGVALAILISVLAERYLPRPAGPAGWCPILPPISVICLVDQICVRECERM